ncbi:MAG: thioesterase family protein [Pseudomonadota bacterium]
MQFRESAVGNWRQSSSRKPTVVTPVFARPVKSAYFRAMTADPSIVWPVARPFVQPRKAVAADIDDFNHVNNVRYIDWAMETAWAHSNALGFTMEDYKRIGVGCVVWNHNFDYKAPVLEGDEVLIATWIGSNDGRLRLTRCFEMRRADDGALCFSGETLFVTIDMASGKPVRMPPSFVEAYKPTV